MAGPKVEVEISAEIAEFKKNLKLAQGQLNEFATDAGNRLKSLGESIKSIALPAGVGAAAIAGIGAAAVVSYGRLQSLEKGLAAVAGSTGAAQKQLEELREVAKLPGLGLEEAVRGSIALQAIGISADEAKRAILQFGNAVATVGKGRAELDRALYGLQQLANTDFPLGEDLNIIKDAIPQVSKLLTEAFGANRSDELAKLGITSKQVVETILTGLEQLPRVAGGVENAIENMQDGITEAWQEIGKAINEALDIEGAMNRVGDAIGGVVEWFRALDPEMRDAIVYIGAGTAAFLGLVAAAGAIITIAPLVAASITTMTVGIAAITTAIGVASVSVIANWSKMSYIITSINSDILSGLSKLIGAIGKLASLAGLETIATSLITAGGVLEAQSDKLSDKADIMRFELFLANKEISKTSDVASEAADRALKLANGLSVGSGSAKKMASELTKLNAQIALNGKLFKPGEGTKEQDFRTLDRGITIPSGSVNIEGVLPDVIAAAKELADTFNDEAGVILRDGLVDVFSGLGQAVGEAIASGGNALQAAGASLLAGLGNILIDLGKMAIKIGVGIKAIKLSLKTLNPFVAIAAGVALVALGSAFAAGASRLSDSMGGGTAGQGSGSNQGTFTTGEVVRSMDIRGDDAQLFLRGSDIYLAGNRYQAQIGRA